MAFPEQHARFTVRCVMVAAPELEEAVFGLRFRLTALPGETQVEDLYTITNNYLQSTDVNLSSAWAIESVKLAFINPDGRYELDALEYIAPTLDSGPGTIPVYPPQTAVAVTTLTDARRGYASRGRYYLPPLAKYVGADGRISPADALSIATRSALWIDQMTDEMGAPAAVFSNVGSGAVRNILSVGCGRVLDTQRRRRRSLDEDRQEALVNP